MLKNDNEVATYKYDDFGERTLKKVGAQATHYVFPFFENKAVAQTQYVMLGSMRIAKIENGTPTYMHEDHLGSNRIRTDASGLKVGATTNFTPFGEFQGTPEEGPQYTGQHYDAETGLYYYGARYYNPKTGRFITSDWVVPNPLNSQSFNRYSYVANNPVNFVDPSGNNSISVEFVGSCFDCSPRYVQLDPGSQLDNYVSQRPTSGADYISSNLQSRAVQSQLSSTQSLNNIQATAEFAGILDPTPTIDLANAAVYAQRGQYGNAVASGVSAVPYAGDLIGKGGKYIFLSIGALKKERVFWSGGKEALEVAKKFAGDTGRETLEMTKSGSRLENAAQATRKGWIYASKRFAQGAEGVVHVFRKATLDPKSIWKTIEEPILKNSSKVNKIIEHIIK